MATQAAPERDPVDAEIDRVLTDDPGLLGRLKEVDRKRARGELVTIPHEEVLRRLGIDRKAR